MKRGARVRMTEAFKAELRGKCGKAGKHLGPFDPGNGGDDPGGDCWGCSSEHVEEFGDSVGTVLGLADYNNCEPDDPGYDATKVGPEVTVLYDDNLRYHYNPDSLEEVP